MVEEERVGNATGRELESAAVDVVGAGDKLLVIDIEFASEILGKATCACHAAVHGEDLTTLNVNDTFVARESDDWDVEICSARACSEDRATG